MSRAPVNEQEGGYRSNRCGHRNTRIIYKIVIPNYIVFAGFFQISQQIGGIFAPVCFFIGSLGFFNGFWNSVLQKIIYLYEEGIRQIFIKTKLSK